MENQQLNLLKGYHYPMEFFYENRKKNGITLLSLDLTSKCNYDCIWCSNKVILNKDDANILPLKEKIRILNEARDNGAKTFIAVGVGEPSLDQDFYSLVEAAYKNDMITILYSNITGNINKKKIKFLFDHNVSISIKLDSFNMSHFIERNNTNLKTFYKFITNFYTILDMYKGTSYTEERDGKKVNIHRIIGNMVINLENKVELEPMAELCKNFDLPLYIRPIRPVDWAEKDPEMWKKLGNPSGEETPAQELVDLANKYNTLFCPSSTILNHCALYTFGLVLRNNGDVLICPDGEKSRGQFGNVIDQSVKEAIARVERERIVKPGYCHMLPDIEHDNN